MKRRIAVNNFDAMENAFSILIRFLSEWLMPIDTANLQKANIKSGVGLIGYKKGRENSYFARDKSLVLRLVLLP